MECSLLIKNSMGTRSVRDFAYLLAGMAVVLISAAKLDRPAVNIEHTSSAPYTIKVGGIEPDEKPPPTKVREQPRRVFAPLPTKADFQDQMTRIPESAAGPVS